MNRKERRLKERALGNKRSIEIVNVSESVYNSLPSVESKPKKHQRKTKYVPFFDGDNNLFIHDLFKKALRSATNGSIIRSKVALTVGAGVEFKDENDEIIQDKEFLKLTKVLNSKYENFDDVYRKAALHWIGGGNLWIKISKGAGRTNWNVIDSTKCRTSWDRKTVYVSAHWEQIKNSKLNNANYAYEDFEAWNGDLDTKQKEFIIHVKNEFPGYDYYGLADYIHGLTDMDVEYESSKYNQKGFINEFSAGHLLTFIGDKPEGMTKEEFETKLTDKFVGSKNAKKPMVLFVDHVDQKPIIEEVGSNNEGKYLELAKQSSDRIVLSHRWNLKIIGVETTGKLGGDNEINNLQTMLTNTVVKPDCQRPLNRVFQLCFELSGFPNIFIRNNNEPLVDSVSKLDPNKVLTVDEGRSFFNHQPIGDERGSEIIEPKKETTNNPNNGN